MKKILVISNNPFDLTQHNAKTILSLLGDKELFSVRQIFLKDGSPGYKSAEYYRLTDREVLRSIVHPSNMAGSEVQPNKLSVESQNNNRTIKHSEISRFLREILWNFGKIDYERMFKWIERDGVDIIFFMGGDCCFAYDVFAHITEQYPNVPNVIYLTDDYILPRNKFNIFLTIRRKMLLSKMMLSVPKANLLITISEEMRKEYRRIFNKDSYVYANIPVEIRDMENQINDNSCVVGSKNYTLSYTGGLHYNRWKVLRKLGLAIQKYNVINNTHIVLNIYAPLKPSNRVLSKLNIENGSCFCGALNSGQVEDVLIKSDSLVFVECFDKKSIASTRLSFSTKIYEYLSYKKPVLAIGPDMVSSIKFLTQCAYCITNYKKISPEELNIFFLKEKQNQVAAECFNMFMSKYNDDFGKQKIVDTLLSL